MMAGLRSLTSTGQTAIEYAGHVVKDDLLGLLRYGRSAPRWAERIWVDPDEVQRVAFGYRNDRSGYVLAGWEARLEDVSTLPKVQASLEHWCNGVSWTDTGIFEFLNGIIAEHGEYDGCRTQQELVERYESIDLMFEQARRERRLRTRRELSGRRAFRELGGVRVHIGPACEPVFGGAGQHRLAIAKALRLPVMPAQIGVVHPDVLPQWRRRYADGSV